MLVTYVWCVQTIGWWTYELCYNDVIKQYHLDGMFKRVWYPKYSYTERNMIIGDTYVLGRYRHSTSPQDVHVPPNHQRYFVQNYTDGTACDLTTQLRRTEVRVSGSVRVRAMNRRLLYSIIATWSW
jgi:protein OS-9